MSLDYVALQLLKAMVVGHPGIYIESGVDVKIVREAYALARTFLELSPEAEDSSVKKA